ncbi:probable 26S proteasome non-ATPase regulatory subunit 3 [Tigriopus californicus]|uniref:probable 26S proteasome non-ATPase regulatory subunit 3 n=1 Tax=Tigriopus californicus TaxID=6832 RepID=UPI0027DA9FB4|nr:probable 26S proteasome non-ATPase regulatory subunit 3 [Tigriopus californicus]
MTGTSDAKSEGTAEIKNAAAPTTGSTATGKTEAKPKDANTLVIDEIREHCRLIERTVVSKEPRFMVRVLRSLFALRKKINVAILRRLVHGFYTHSVSQKQTLLAYLDQAAEMDTTEGGSPTGPAPPNTRLRGAKSALTPLLPEVDAYLQLLIFLHLSDRGSTSALTCGESLVAKLIAYNRRTLDHLAARIYYYYAMAYESGGRASEIRGFLHSRLRTATLRHDFEGQAVLINCLLRSYISQNLFDQADKLVNKTSFPETASNNEWARYLYYLGRIKAIQLEYSEAHKHLVQSLRKAPQSTAVGFKHTVMKLNITVELLLGEIPERRTFLQKENKRALAPYLMLTQAVRSGDVKRFDETLENYAPQFKTDHTYTLILRLHHNVIKTAIRTISLAYTRISLSDVAQKLSLDSAQDAEYIIAKAIRDGVIEATLDHDQGWMQSKENVDIYSTREPQLAFHQRIEFCLDLHNSSVKAMRFPPKSYNQDLESAEDRREREAQDLELAKEMAEDDDDLM